MNNNAAFPQNTVKGTMKLLALLIDWNELSLFENLVTIFKQSIAHKNFRIGGFYCIGAICGKGMPEDQKVKII